MTNTNTAVLNVASGLEFVESKSMVTSKGRTTSPAQVRVLLEVGKKSQRVTFGFSRLGGRKTYLLVEGSAPVEMKKEEFLAKLVASNICNVKEVASKLNILKPVFRDEFVVAKCQQCETGLVTAANVDYIQRRSAELTAKLGYEVSPFSCICRKCQGAPARVKKEEVTTTRIPASAKTATCASCTKEVVSAGVIKFSLQKFGKVLCYGKCQTKEAQAKAKLTVVETPESPIENTLLTPEVICEIMELETEAFSALAKLQEELRDTYSEQRKQSFIDFNNTSPTEKDIKADLRNQIKEFEASETSAPALPLVQETAPEKTCTSCSGTHTQFSNGVCEDCWADQVASGLNVNTVVVNADTVVESASEASTPITEYEVMELDSASTSLCTNCGDITDSVGYCSDCSLSQELNDCLRDETTINGSYFSPEVIELDVIQMPVADVELPSDLDIDFV